MSLYLIAIIWALILLGDLIITGFILKEWGEAKGMLVRHSLDVLFFIGCWAAWMLVKR